MFDSGAEISIITKKALSEVNYITEEPNVKHEVSGIGGTQYATRHDICIKKRNGGIIVFPALSVEHIMTTRREYNISSLIKLLLKNAPPYVQNFKIYEEYGSEIDLLAGIHLIQYFPEPVYTIKSGDLAGLSVYQSKLMTHDSSQIYTVGGTYKQWSIHEGEDIRRTFYNITKTLSSFKPSRIPVYLSTTKYSILSNTINPASYESLSNIPPKEEAKPDPLKVVCDDSYLLKPSVTKQNQAIEAADTYREEYKEKISKNELKAFQKDVNFLADYHYYDNRCLKCTQCTVCRTIDTEIRIKSTFDQEEEIMSKSVRFDKETKKFVATLPFTKDPEVHLKTNKEEVYKRFKTLVRNMRKKPQDLAVIKESFEKLVKLGHIVRFDHLPEDIQRIIENNIVNYWIPWSVAYKKTSLSTPCRLCADCSAKSSTGKSLNCILAKGKVCLDFLRIAMNLRMSKYCVICDLSKFYNSIDLDPKHYNYQNTIWTDDFDKDIEPTRYIIKSVFYGVRSSSRHLEIALEYIAEENKHLPHIYKFLIFCRYVDDLVGNCDTREQAQQLIDDASRILVEYGFSIKGWLVCGEKPDPKLVDNGICCVAGYLLDVENDVISIRVHDLYFEGSNKKGKITALETFTSGTFDELNKFVPPHITLRYALKNISTLFDPSGIISPWMYKKKALFRETVKALEGPIWDATVPPSLRDKYVHLFSDMQYLKTYKYPRYSITADVDESKKRLICFSDASLTGMCQVVYLCKPDKDGQYHSMMLYSKSQISKETMSIPMLELQSMSHAANLLHKAMTCVPDATDVYMMTDSEIVCFWLRKNLSSLSTFVRNRVAHIVNLIDLNCVYHCKSRFNIADMGTRNCNIEEIKPGSVFHKGLPFMSDLNKATKDGIITPISKITMTERALRSGRDGLQQHVDLPDDYFYNIVALNSSTWKDYLLFCYECKERDPDVEDVDFSGDRCIERIYYEEDFDRDETEPELLTPNNNVVLVNKVTVEATDDRETDEITDISRKQKDIISVPKDPKLDMLPKVDLKKMSISELTSKFNFNKPTVDKVDDSVPSYGNPEPEDPLNPSSIVKEWTEEEIPGNPYNTKETLSRFNMHTYLLNPITLGWKMSVNALAFVFFFKDKLMKKTTPLMTGKLDLINFLKGFESDLTFELPSKSKKTANKIGYHNTFVTSENLLHYRLLAITYFIKLASQEALRKLSRGTLKKYTYVHNGLLITNSRISNTVFLQNELQNIEPIDFHVQPHLPFMDRYSPVTCALVAHIHNNVSKHAGYFRTNLILKQTAFVFKIGNFLQKLIAFCKICRRKNLIKHHVTEGPIENRFTFAPTGQYQMLDISGPFFIKSGKRNTDTRAQKSTMKVYLLHSICIITRYSCVEIMFDYSCAEFVLAYGRIATRVGFASKAYIDNSQTEIKGLGKTFMYVPDLQNECLKRFNTEIITCGTGSSSHSRNGAIERCIGVFKGFIKKYEKQIKSFSVSEFTSLIQHAAVCMNSWPLGAKTNTHNKTLMCNIVTPFSFLCGLRTPHRMPIAPPQFESMETLLKNIDNFSAELAKFYALNLTTHLLKNTKHKSSDEQLHVGDIVFFPHTVGAIMDTQNYKIGKIVDLPKDSDQESRLPIVEYSNSSEIYYPLQIVEDDEIPTKFVHRTPKAATVLIKIHTLNDIKIYEELELISSRTPSDKSYITLSN